jgi:ribosomal protein L39E
LSTPSEEIVQIHVEVPAETKRKLERMKLLKGIKQNEIVPAVIIAEVDRKYEEIFRRKGPDSGSA